MLFEFGMKSEKDFVCVLLLAYLYLLSTKMANSNLFGENISLIHQEFVAAYKERFLCENTHVASVKNSKLWQKMRRENKTLSNLKSQVSALIKKGSTNQSPLLQKRHHSMFLEKLKER